MKNKRIAGKKRVKTNKITGRLNAYMRWPLILTVIVACMDSVLFVVNKKAGFVGILFFVIYAICAALIWRYRNRGMFGDLVRYAAGYGRVQKRHFF
ncbi:MAG: hypothetical protein K6G65_02235 [Lachnospiraceae bacterium]|nr:hypothetical protein [Lachnospiraceae bacterium]